MKERASGGGEPDAGHFVDGPVCADAAAAETLVDGIVLAIDGQERLALAAGFGGDEFAGHNQTFLIGQADGFASFDGLESGFEAGDADDGADDEIDIGMGGDADGSGCAVEDFGAGQSGGAKFSAEGVGRGFAGYGDDLGLPAQSLIADRLEIVAGGQRSHLKAVGIGFNNAESAAADGAGRTKDGDTFHALE